MFEILPNYFWDIKKLRKIIWMHIQIFWILKSARCKSSQIKYEYIFIMNYSLRITKDNFNENWSHLKKSNSFFPSFIFYNNILLVINRDVLSNSRCCLRNKKNMDILKKIQTFLPLLISKQKKSYFNISNHINLLNNKIYINKNEQETLSFQLR